MVSFPHPFQAKHANAERGRIYRRGRLGLDSLFSASVLLLALILLSGSCRSLTSSDGGETAHLGPLLVESAPPFSGTAGRLATKELPYPPFSMIYPFLNGMLRRLELAPLLSDEEKLRFILRCCSLINAAKGRKPAAKTAGEPVLVFRLPDYFERGDLLIRLEYRTHPPNEPERFLWKSNALANPATGAPLRGRGGYAETGPLRNIGGTILRLPRRLVSASDLYSPVRERRLRAGGELLLLAHAYLFDEMPSHTRWARMLAESIISSQEQPRERRAAALCLLGRLLLMEERYAEAEAAIARAEPLCAGEPVYLRRLLNEVREEHRLAKALALEYH